MALSGSLNFLSASLTGSDNIKVDFVGLSTLIADPVSASSNELGHTQDTFSWAYYNSNIESQSLGYAPNYLNSLILHRNGPYQHPTWKQYRGGDHPVARHLRLNNTMSIDAAFPNAIKREGAKRSSRARRGKMTLGELKDDYTNLNNTQKTMGAVKPHGSAWFPKNSLYAFPNLIQYYEPPVVKKYKPLIYDIDYASGMFGAQTSRVRTTLMNQMVFFQNKELNSGLKIAGTSTLTGTQANDGFITPKQQYYGLLRTAKELGARKFVYSQTIFPKSINTFRTYKLERLDYEEGPAALANYGRNHYDKVFNRSFWRDSQPGLGEALTDPNGRAAKFASVHTTGGSFGGESVDSFGRETSPTGGSRIRNIDQCENSQEIVQYLYSAKVWTDCSASACEVGGSNTSPFAVQGLVRLMCSKGPAGRISAGGADGGGWYNPAWSQTNRFIEGGIIAGGAVDTTTGSKNADGLPSVAPFAAFVQHETYNPYPIALLSMWPLDPRPDIYDKPSRPPTAGEAATYVNYLTSTIGGQGLQIGTTPHRMKEYNTLQGHADFGTWPAYTYAKIPLTASNNSIFTGSHTSSSYPAYVTTNAQTAHMVTASYLQLKHMQTGNAGELVYNTKPTMFYHRALWCTPVTSQHKTRGVTGYRYQTASLQYNRHTFPYNTPFYATNKIRGRNPFFNSYALFSEDIQYLARDYSIIPEYRAADNIEYYYENYFIGQEDKELFVDQQKQDSPKHPPVRKILRTFKPPSMKISNFKLDLLQVQGAAGTNTGTTSSAGCQPGKFGCAGDEFSFTSFGPTTPSTLSYDFDPLLQTAVETTLNTELIHYSQNAKSVIFYEKFSHTDDIIEFSHLVDEPFSEGANTIPSKIKFTVDALKKFLPYKNLYPVTKTVDIGARFKQFIYQNLKFNPLTGSEDPHSKIVDQPDRRPGQLQSFLEPLFAPGILFNSIKSGIAVDYPVFKSKQPAYFAPLPFMSGAVTASSKYPNYDFGPTKNSHGGSDIGEAHGFLNSQFNADNGDSHRFDPQISSSFNYGGFYMLGASRCIPAILNRAPNARLPFETIYDTSYLDDFVENALYLTADFLDLDRNPPQGEATASSVVGVQSVNHPGAAFTNTGPRGFLSTKPSLMKNKHKAMYESSINNFLCETMNFFLADLGEPGIKLPIAVSRKKSSNDLNFVDDNKYFMEVSLHMGADHVSCEGPRSAGIGGGSANGAAHTGVDNMYANNLLSASMRGYIYGPPIEAVQMSGNVTIPQSAFDEIIDPDTGDVSAKTDPRVASYLNADGTVRGQTAATATITVATSATGSSLNGDEFTLTDNTRGGFKLDHPGATAGGHQLQGFRNPNTVDFDFSNSSAAVDEDGLIGTQIAGSTYKIALQIVKAINYHDGYNHNDGAGGAPLFPGFEITASLPSPGGETASDENSQQTITLTQVQPGPGGNLSVDFSGVTNISCTNFSGGDIQLNCGDFESYFGANLQDPAYQAFTPPYFYGDSSLIVSFTPASQETGIIYDMPTAVGKSKSESFNFEHYETGSGPATTSSFDSLCRYVPGTGSIAGLNNVRMKIESSIDIFNSPGSSDENIITIFSKKAGVTALPEHMWYIAPKWICPVLDFSSSFSAVDTYQTIKTKTDNNPPIVSTITNSFHDNTTGRGLWGGYGTDPYDLAHMAAIYGSLDSKDLPDDRAFEKGIYFSVKFPFKGEQNEQSTAVYKGDFTSKVGHYTVNEVTDDSALTQSLVDKFGFEEASFPIGQFASEKIISEAIIIIPYLEKPFDIKAGSQKQQGGAQTWQDVEVPGNEIYSTREIIPGKHFLPIHRTLFENILSMKLATMDFLESELLSNDNNPAGSGFVGFELQESLDAAKGTDVYNMIDMLLGDENQDRSGYEIPAEFDFINYNIDPFQMIVVPVTHTLQKQDLIDIYQGIMPELSLKAEKGRASATVTPAREAGDFSWMPEIISAGATGGTISLSAISPQNFLTPAAIIEYHNNHLGDYMDMQLSTVWLKNSKEFYRNLKFMTFKVKQKGIKDYKRYRNKQISRTIKAKARAGLDDPASIDFSENKIIDQPRKVKDVFGYNWPYDDFSLAEAVKIDVEFEVTE